MSLSTNSRFVHPDIVTSHFHLREGDTVADFGAGTGFFLQALSRAVGHEGRVYACEIHRNLVEKLGTQAREWRLTNIEPLWSDIEAPGGSKLAPSILDAGLLINTLYQIEDKPAALREIARVMRSGGKLFVIDWTDSFGGLGPHPGHVVSQNEAQILAEANGFRFERSFPAGEHHYGLAMRRV